MKNIINYITSIIFNIFLLIFFKNMYYAQMNFIDVNIHNYILQINLILKILKL